LGKFLNKSIKRQIYSLLYSEDNLSIFRVEYYTNIIEMKDVADFDYSNSKAYKRQNNNKNIEIETEAEAEAACAAEIQFESEEEAKKFEELYPLNDIYLYDIDIVDYNENEFLKKMLPLVAATGKKIVVNTKENVENFACNVIRYFAINGNYLLIIFSLIFLILFL